MILIILGALLLIVGGIWELIIAFRRSVIWGVCYLFVPFAAILFLIVAWADAKRPFLLRIVGLLVIASVFLLPDQGGFKVKTLNRGSLAKSGWEIDVPPMFPPKNPVDSRLAELRERETVLKGRKAALDPNDLAAAQALTDEILKYNADLKAVTDGQAASQGGGASVVSYNSAPK